MGGLEWVGFQKNANCTGMFFSYARKPEDWRSGRALPWNWEQSSPQPSGWRGRTWPQILPLFCFLFSYSCQDYHCFVRLGQVLCNVNFQKGRGEKISGRRGCKRGWIPLLFILWQLLLRGHLPLRDICHSEPEGSGDNRSFFSSFSFSFPLAFPNHVFESSIYVKYTCKCIHSYICDR